MTTPIRKMYSKTQPYVVERHDWEDGIISYEIWDLRHDTYRRLCSVYEDDSGDDEQPAQRGQAKKDAKLIARALNALDIGSGEK